jgi:hypothetical protein
MLWPLFHLKHPPTPRGTTTHCDSSERRYGMFLIFKCVVLPVFIYFVLVQTTDVATDTNNSASAVSGREVAPHRRQLQRPHFLLSPRHHQRLTDCFLQTVCACAGPLTEQCARTHTQCGLSNRSVNSSEIPCEQKRTRENDSRSTGMQHRPVSPPYVLSSRELCTNLCCFLQIQTNCCYSYSDKWLQRD